MIMIQRTNRLRILCLNTLEGTSFVVQVEGTSTWVVVTENKRGYISCGSVQVEGTSTWLFKENKGWYIPCGSFLVKDFTRLKEISRTGGCLGTGCRHGSAKVDVSLSELNALSECHPLSEASTRLVDRRNLEGNLSRRHALSASSSRSASHLSPSRLSASLALSESSLTCAKCKNGTKRDVEELPCYGRLNPQFGILAEGFSIERCIVFLELDRAGLGYRMSGHEVRCSPQNSLGLFLPWIRVKAIAHLGLGVARCTSHIACAPSKKI
ncbi:hypothetical protein HKD37_01G000894 [Glycine soja]